MKLKYKHTMKPVVTAIVLITGMCLIQLTEMDSFFIRNARIGIQTASAETQYGILGQTAPELQLNAWIDENGKEMEPVSLNDCRGKVVYLYFFQHW